MSSLSTVSIKFTSESLNDSDIHFSSNKKRKGRRNDSIMDDVIRVENNIKQQIKKVKVDPVMSIINTGKTFHLGYLNSLPILHNRLMLHTPNKGSYLILSTPTNLTIRVNQNEDDEEEDFKTLRKYCLEPYIEANLFSYVQTKQLENSCITVSILLVVNNFSNL